MMVSQGPNPSYTPRWSALQIDAGKTNLVALLISTIFN